MPDYRKYVPFVLKWEGGWSDHKADRGGKTNMGITWETYNSLAFKVLSQYPSMTHFQNLTKNQAALFVEYFWNKATNNNRIKSQKVAEAVTSWMWGSGAYGLKMFQRMLNQEFGGRLTEDGVIGDMTTEFVNKQNPNKVFSKMSEYRAQFFHDLVKRDPSQAVFLNGWLNRLKDFTTRHPTQAVAVAGTSGLLLVSGIGLVLFKLLKGNKKKRN